MKTYYYSTTPDNKSNMILGYVTEDGDFFERSEYEDFQKEDDGEFPIFFDLKIVVEEGLLSCGETFEEFCQRVAKIACKDKKNWVN